METKYIIEIIALIIFCAVLFVLKKTNIFNQKSNIEEDVMSILEEGQEQGAIKEEGKKMINSIFAFDDELAYEIMTPRTDVFMIDINDPAEEYIDQLMELRHTRIPVYDDDPDNIIGILNIKDYLIQARKQGFDNIEIKPILRDAYFVPESKKIDTLFFEMQKSRQQIAILIDEYGGFSGIVTMEDVLEQLVGEIFDEQDEVEELYVDQENGTYFVDGSMNLDDFFELVGFDEEFETDYTTVSGLCQEILDRFAKVGDKFSFGSFECEVLEADEFTVDKLKVVDLNYGKDEEE